MAYMYSSYVKLTLLYLVHDVLFIYMQVVSFPGDNPEVRTTKAAVFLIGIAFTPAIPVMLARAVLPRKRNQDVVANNPSVCIMQAGPGILCTAWLTNPLRMLADSSSSGAGAVISHCLFGLSTFSFLCVLLSLYQRKTVLATIGVDPQWAPMSFPFINSAIAAGTYRSLFPSPAITVWCFLLTAIAITNHTIVNCMYLSKLWFLCDNFGIYNRVRQGSVGDDEGCAVLRVNPSCDSISTSTSASASVDASAGRMVSTHELSSMVPFTPVAKEEGLCTNDIDKDIYTTTTYFSR